jgi:multidrug transporter EmrE-like cation transporter
MEHELMRLAYFGLVFLLNGSFSALSYSSLKHSRYGIFLAVLMGMCGSSLWIFLARTITNPDQLLAYGFYSDIVSKVATIAVPLLLFGIKCDMRTIMGMSLMISGILVWK